MRYLSEIEFSDIRLDRAEFVLDVFPTSLLSKKPAARIQELESFINAGWITREDAMMLLEMPDLERAGNMILASTRIIEKVVDKMLDAEDPYADDVYTYPEPAFNLRLCISKGIQMYLDAKLDGAPEENLQLVMQFVTDAKDQLASSQGATEEAAPAELAMPPEQSMAPPPPGPPVEEAAGMQPEMVAPVEPMDPNIPPRSIT